MKKVSIVLLAVLANLSLISCTEENLADIINPGNDIYATDGEKEHIDPEEEPPGND